MPRVEFPHDHQKWSQMVEILTNLKGESNLEDIFNNLATLHAVKCNLPETQPLEDTPFAGLCTFFKEMAEDEETGRFVRIVLPTIAILALDIKRNTAVDGLSFSSKNQHKATPLNRKFIASVLACGFLCLFPEECKPESLTGINFDWFFHALTERQEQHEKLRCILHYFERMSVMYRNLSESVVFTRVHVPETELFSADGILSIERPLCRLGVYTHVAVEDPSDSVLLASSSNEFIGGDVLDRGCSREEIYFVTCPELLVGLLFIESLEKSECVTISGFQQFAAYTGVGKHFQYEGPCTTEYQRDMEGNLKTAIACMDAYRFAPTREGIKHQFETRNIMREINKAYVAFCQPGTNGSTRNAIGGLGDVDKGVMQKEYPVDLRPVVTGNWGCGQMGGGDYQLKAMIQWIAASLARVPNVRYYTQRKPQMDDLELIVDEMLDTKWTIGKLSRAMFKFAKQVEQKKDKGYGLFTHLETVLRHQKNVFKSKCAIL